MKKMFKYISKYWYLAILAPLFMIIEVLMDMVLTSYMERLVDYAIPSKEMDIIVRYGLIMLLIVGIGVLTGILSGIFTNLTSYKFGNDLRKDVFKKIMGMSLDQSDDFRTGSLVTRVTNDITQIQNMISMCLRGLIRSLSFFVIGIIFTLNVSVRFGLILLVILPLQLITMILFMRYLFPIFSIIQGKLDRVNTVVLENVTGARVVKAFSKEDYEYIRFKDANDDYTALNLKVGKIGAIMMPLLNIIVFGGQLFIYHIGGQSMINAFQNFIEPDIMIGEITQAITYIVMIVNGLLMLGMLFANIARGIASTKRVNEVLDAPLDLIDGDLDFTKVSDKGTIEFKNVSFKYPSASNNILNDINLMINKGDTIAIVGSTGCGKSTLVNLIVRFYDVTSGEILVNGHDVREYKKKDLRNTVGICLQKAELFYGTLKDNIKFGVPDATMEDVKKAADIAQASEYILKKELGFDEMVQEKGASLSGGQKQRLSIARAIIRKPDILIFDDSTSALDLVTEMKLYEALKKEMGYVTKIIVAQRIATVRNADKIIVLDSGRIESFGTHEELMAKSNVYNDIYQSQLKREEI